MKKKELATIAREVASCLKGFTSLSDLIIMVPMSHVLRAICVDRCEEPRDLRAIAFFLPLYVPQEDIGFNLGKHLGGGCHFWNADMPGLIEDLLRFIEREALPFLGSPSLGDAEVAEIILKLTSKSRNPHGGEAAAYTLVKMQKYRKALKIMDTLLASVDEQVYWQVEIGNRVRLLKNKLLDDPSTAQQQLNDWEEESIRNLGLNSLRESV